MLCVTLMIYGGLAGGMQRPPVVVDGQGLSPQEHQQLVELVAALKASPPPPVSASGPGRDLQAYVITVEEEGREPMEFEANDLSQTPAFQSLSQWVRSHGRTGP
jgi:hypothetical protein